MRGIIVDDEPIMLRSFMRVSKGIEDLEIVEQFSDPEEVLKWLDDNTCDVAFLDVVMPRITGFELSKKILEKKPGTRIVFTTAYSMDMDLYKEHAHDGYLLKPYRRELMEDLIKSLK